MKFRGMGIFGLLVEDIFGSRRGFYGVVKIIGVE